MNILIIEDEAAAARRIEKMILELRPEARIAGHIDSVQAAVAYFKNHPHPDLCLMDIHLADGPCFEIFKQTEIQCPCIFTTAYDQYALQAFKVNSIDYLLKPVKKEELDFSLRKFEQSSQSKIHPAFQQLMEQMGVQRKTYRQRFAVRSGTVIRSVEVKDIVAFYAEEKVVFLHTSEDRRYLLDQSLDKIMDELDPEAFFRVHRGVIVHYPFILQMHSYLKGRIKIDLKIQLPVDLIVSADRAADFRDWIGR